ncbi:hypothetical protein BH10ACI1_BH10ACI1_12440 [soil metagenome]
MSFQKFYKQSFGLLFLILTAVSGAVLAQTQKPTMIMSQQDKELPIVMRNNLYCAGYISKEKVNTKNEIVGAENEQEQYIYSQNNNLYISLGANQGVKVGDMFSVVRPRGKFKSRFSRKGNLGIYVQEVGAVEVISVKDNVSVARVTVSCDSFLLGDLIQPIPQRTSPIFTQRPALDVFANASGKITGKIVFARGGQEMLGREQIVYIDLGQEDNVKIGDYLTIFRPLGTGNLFISDEDEIVGARDRGFKSSEYGGGTFSSGATRRKNENATGDVINLEEAKQDRPNNLRKVVGELVIINVKERTATAVIVRTSQEIHTGDSVELQ